MSKKPVGYRMCIACRTSFPKDELLRLYRAEDGAVKIGNGIGKGVYVCRTEQCVERMKKKKILNHVFRQPIPEELYEAIRP